MKKIWLFLTLLCSFFVFSPKISLAGEQQFSFQPGWNLICFQVLPQNRSPEMVFGSMKSCDDGKFGLYNEKNPNKSKVKAVFTFCPETGWSKFLVGGYECSEGNRIPEPEENISSIDFESSCKTGKFSNISEIEFGRGYFIYVDRISNDTCYSLIGDEPEAADLAISLKSGWNLIGVPVNLSDLGIDKNGHTQTKIGINEIFGHWDLEKIDIIARFESKNKGYHTYKPADPGISTFRDFNPDLGYWIYAQDEFFLKPEMIIHAPGDEDHKPVDTSVKIGKEWSPGPEDREIGIPGTKKIFDDKTTQSVVLIPKGLNSVRLPLDNYGGGILSWQASLHPYEEKADASAIPLRSPEEVNMVLSLLKKGGIVTSKTDTIEIVVDRSRLAPGVYLATLKIEANSGQQKEFSLVIEAGGLDGEWEGSAHIDTINGKANEIPDIDLVLHLFHDYANDSNLIRGIIDSQETLLWPMDAQLLGYLADTPPRTTIDSNYASRFVISGGFTMPPGDINHFPFDSFPDNASEGEKKTDPDTGLEYCTNDEGDRFYHSLRTKPDFINPYDKFICREVELRGGLTRSDKGAAVVAGDYFETISGMLPEPILLKGTFRLVRRRYTPLEHRPYKYHYKIPGGQRIRAKSSFDGFIEVNKHILVKRVVVILSHDIPTEKHKISLTSPRGKTVLLHGGEDVGPAQSVIFDSGDLPANPTTLLEPPELRRVTRSKTDFNQQEYESDLRGALANYIIRHPRESLAVLNDTDAFGNWQLRVDNLDKRKSHRLKGWSLMLYGTKVDPLEGSVVVEGNSDPARFQDIEVEALGLIADLDEIHTEFNTTNGRFTVRGLPGLRVNLLSHKPGYPPAYIDGLNTDTDPRGFKDRLGGILVGEKMSQDLILTLRQPDLETPKYVSAFPLNFEAESVDGKVEIKGLELALIGRLPDGVAENQIRWQPNWDGKTGVPDVMPELFKGRAVSLDLTIPANDFKADKNHSLAFRPRAFLGSTENSVSYEGWVVVFLKNPPDSQPYLRGQGLALQGFGAETRVIFGQDDKETRINAQKTDVGKVDIDRPPLCDQNKLDLGKEDSDLHPRDLKTKTKQSFYSYAIITELEDGKYSALRSNYDEEPVYDDHISGRNINGPEEPVRIFTAIGGQVVDMGLSGTNGVQRISAGVNPGR